VSYRDFLDVFLMDSMGFSGIFSPMSEPAKTVFTKLGLALSGSGYRAAAFHLGTLSCLHRMGYLDHVKVLSTISGGSITGAAYCLRRDEDVDSFCQRMKDSLLGDSVFGQVFRSSVFMGLIHFVLGSLAFALALLFTCLAPAAPFVLGLLVWLLLRYQFRWFPISREVEKAYDTFFYHGQSLTDLPVVPELAMGSSNLETGRPFTFARGWMGDSTYSYDEPAIRFKTMGFSVARAVTASSCAPFAFPSVGIAPQFFQQAADTTRIRPQLIDGGVYDNQGMQKLTQAGSHLACDLIIASDAGGGWSYLNVYHNTATLLLRTVDLFMNRIRNFQMANNLYQHAAGRGRPATYIALSWCIDRCIPGFVDNMIQGNVLPEILAARQLPPAWIEAPEQHRSQIEAHLKQLVGYAAIARCNVTDAQWNLARQVGTNLKPLTPAQLGALVQQAENITELQVKLYLP
jgi:NTE family protein